MLYSAFSSFADASLTWDDASVLIPAPSDSVTPENFYTILEQEVRDFVTLPMGSGIPGDLPDKVWLIIRDERNSDYLKLSLPVEWDWSDLDTTSPGVRTVYGTFDTGGLDGVYHNPDDIRPELQVICVEDNHIFIQNWSTYETEEDYTLLYITLPYPDRGTYNVPY